MCGRSRQMVLLLLLVLVMALVSVGCGGGDEEPVPGDTTAATVAPPAVSGGEGDVQIGLPDGERIADTYVPTTEDTPQEFTNALSKGTPIVVLFYVNGGTDDVAVMESLDRLEASFNRYTFLKYDYSKPDAYGDLSTLLQVTYPPEMILIDRAGIIRQVWSGFVDEGTLNQSLVNLGRE